MIGARSTFRPNRKAVEKAAEKGNFRNLFHAAASIRKSAAKSISKRKGPSEPGEPPHTHRRGFYRRALRYHVSRKNQEALIGFRHSVVGDVARVHEFGLRRGDQKYPERPTLGPALEEAIPRLGFFWKGSIGA